LLRNPVGAVADDDGLGSIVREVSLVGGAGEVLAANVPDENLNIGDVDRFMLMVSH